MCLLIEIGMLIFGIVTLKGRFQVSKTKVAMGGPAYVIGLLLIALFPLALVIGFYLATQGGGEVDMEELQRFAAVEPVLVLIFLIAALIVGVATGKDPAVQTPPLPDPSAAPPLPHEMDLSDPANPYRSPADRDRPPPLS